MQTTPGPTSACAFQLHLAAREPPPPQQAPAARPGATAAQSLPGKQPTAQQEEGDVERSPQQARSLRVTVTTTQPHILYPSVFCKPDHSSTACCIKHSLPPALALSHPLPCWPSFGWFPQAKFVSITGAFPLSVFICFLPFLMREVSHAQAPESSPSPLIISLKHILLFQANVIWCFRAYIFKDKKCQKNTTPFQHKAGHGLPHCCYIQGTCSKHLAPAKGGGGKTWWFLPLIQDFNPSTAQATSPLNKSPFLALLPNEGNKPNASHPM